MSAPPSPPPISYNVSGLTVEQYFGYSPSLALAYTAAALFLAAAVIITLQVFISRNSNARYSWLLVFTALAECGGYIALIWMIYATGTTSLYSGYVAMQCLIVLSPNILQAAVYRTVGQIARVGNVSEKGGCLSAKFISIFFILIDVCCLIVQAVGISIWASEKSSGDPDVDRVKLGSYITVVGLGLQLISFASFLVLARYIQKHEHNTFKKHWQHGMLYAGVYLSIIFVSIRNVFRFIEFLQGAIVYPEPSSIAENQVLFYCLETLPVLLAFLALIIFSPTYLLPKTKPLEAYMDSSPFANAADADLEAADNKSSGDSMMKAGDVVVDDDRLRTVELN